MERRREQNRESQRKFRARKEAKIREAASQVAALESYVEFLEKHNNDLEGLNAELRHQIASMEGDQQIHPIQTPGSARTEAFVEALELWGSRSPVLDYPQSAESANPIPRSPDLHLSLFDHELLPPSRRG